MTQLFLKAKHWQLFIFMFVIPILFQTFLMFSIFSNVLATETADPATIFGFFSFLKFLPLIFAVSIVAFFGWIWSLAIGLDKKIPDELKLKKGLFKFFFFYPIIYLTLFVCLISWGMGAFIGEVSAGQEAFAGFDIENMKYIVLIFPMHFFCLVCMFYCMYFAAKSYKTAELQLKVTFGDFVGEFFMMWFYYVGVWIIQPKVNKMIVPELENSLNDNLL